MRGEKTIGYIAFNKEKGYVVVCIFTGDGSKIYGHVDPEDLMNVVRGGTAYAKIKAWRRRFYCSAEEWLRQKHTLTA